VNLRLLGKPSQPPSFERLSECLEKVNLSVMEPRMRLRTGDSTKKWSYLALKGTDAFEVRTYLDRVCWNGIRNMDLLYLLHGRQEKEAFSVARMLLQRCGELFN